MSETVALPANIASQGAMIAYDRIADPMDFVNKFGMAMYNAKMFGCNNADQGRVLAMTCLCERKTPTEIIRTYHLMGGKLQMRADAMLAEFRKQGGTHKVIQRDAGRACVELEADGQKQQFSFTWDEAQHEPFVRDKQGGIKDNYATPRARMQMLWARVTSDGVRTMKPEVNAGYYTPEEVADFSASNQPQLSAEAEARRKELLAKDGDGEVIQADFEVVNDKPMGGATQPAEPPSQPAPTAPPADPPAEQPPFEASTEQVEHEPKTTEEQIDTLRGLLQELKMPADKWAEALEKRGVKTARELDVGQAEELIGKLTELRDQTQATDELSQWAENATVGNQPSGNQPAA